MVPTDDTRFAAVATTPVWGHIIKAMELNAKPFGEAEIAWRLPAEDLLIESLAWDAKRAQLLVGGAREGAVYRVGKDGSLRPLVKANAENGLWAVFDIAIDSKRGALWVASTAVPHFKGYDPEKHLGRAGIFEFDLQTGKLRNRHLSPAIAGASFFMSSLAIGPKGEVYAADGVNNAVYTIKDGELKRLFHAPGLSSIRGIAVSEDGKILYSADHQAGIFGFDLVSGQPVELLAPKTLALGGLEGIAWWRGHLIVVQSGMNPKRVMRLKLAPDGRTIVSVQPLLASHPEMDLPTMLTSAGSSVYVIGNSQKSNYDRFGLLRDASRLEGTAVFRLSPEIAQSLPQGMMPVAEPQQ
jgi:sugar lactone lactonase YvrE